MFNFILLLGIVLIQFFPKIATDYLDGDWEWEVWHYSMLSIILLQAWYICRNTQKAEVYKKIISVIILVVSVLFLLDYMFVSAANKIIEYDPLLYNEIVNGQLD